MDLSGFKVLILMAQPQGEVTLLKRDRRGKKQRFYFDIAAQFISSVGNVFSFLASLQSQWTVARK